MLIRCVDCGHKESPFMPMPVSYFTPGGAVRFWMKEHGHIPLLWTFQCECGTIMESGGLVAKANKWDDIALAENDWYFWQEHKDHANRLIWTPS